MAYSNITPPTLPEYDSALYSHYVLEFEYENGSDNWFAVSLRYSSTPFTYDGTAVTNAGEHHLQTYGSGTGEWTYWGTLTEMSIAPGTTSTGGYRRIWTNHNILDGSGNVWLAANTATPAEANLDRLSIMKSKLAGLIMAWCASVRQFPQREPVEPDTPVEPIGYFYGHVAKEGETPTHTIDGIGYVGVVAPKLPVEWNADERPYGLIYTYGSTNELRLTTTKIPLRLYDPGNDGNYTFSHDDPRFPESFENDGTSWVYYWATPAHIEASGYVWSNYDIKDHKGLAGPAGSVYREAGSDPIPVYE